MERRKERARKEIKIMGLLVSDSLNYVLKERVSRNGETSVKKEEGLMGKGEMEGKRENWDGEKQIYIERERE